MCVSQVSMTTTSSHCRSVPVRPDPLCPSGDHEDGCARAVPVLGGGRRSAVLAPLGRRRQRLRQRQRKRRLRQQQRLRGQHAHHFRQRLRLGELNICAHMLYTHTVGEMIMLNGMDHQLLTTLRLVLLLITKLGMSGMNIEYLCSIYVAQRYPARQTCRYTIALHIWFA